MLSIGAHLIVLKFVGINWVFPVAVTQERFGDVSDGCPWTWRNHVYPQRGQVACHSKSVAVWNHDTTRHGDSSAKTYSIVCRMRCNHWGSSWKNDVNGNLVAAFMPIAMRGLLVNRHFWFNTCNFKWESVKIVIIEKICRVSFYFQSRKKSNEIKN